MWDLLHGVRYVFRKEPCQPWDEGKAQLLQMCQHPEPIADVAAQPRVVTPAYGIVALPLLFVLSHYKSSPDKLTSPESPMSETQFVPPRLRDQP